VAGFLSDAQVQRYGRFVGDPPVVELERFFRLGEQALRLVAAKRRDHNRLGFAMQWGTVRMLGRFLPEPVDVPPSVVAFVAEQLGISDCSCIAAYAERLPTQHEHARELRRECGYREFAAGEEELRTCACEDGPRALFDRAVLWLVEHQVLLPGITVLSRLVAEIRAGEHERLTNSWRAPLRPGCGSSLRRCSSVNSKGFQAALRCQVR
jgi:hypothetical protein